MSPWSARRPVAVVMLLAAWSLVACRPAEFGREAPAGPSVDILLPVGDRLTGWGMSTEPETYGPENLWEFMNGQAESYINYGFVRVDTAEYRTQDGARSVVVEIYQMASPDEAFGIYAAERNPDDRQLDIGSGGYLGSNVLNFWQGDLYIKLTSFETGNATDDALTTLAREIAQLSPAGSGGPETFSFFPQENRVQGSERFIPRNFLGQSFLKRSYRVDYADGDSASYQLFLARLDSPDEARAALGQYADFMKSRGWQVELVDGDSATAVSESGTATVVFAHGQYLGGALDAASLEAGQGAADGLRNRLGEAQ